MTFSFELSSSAKCSQRLAVDYRVTFARANGRSSQKVFKLAEKTIAAGESIPLTIKQASADLSTRRHYPGEHRLEVIVNGRSMQSAGFQLKR